MREKEILKVSPEIFKHARVTAERKVRSKSSLEEINIKEIYDELNRTLNLSQVEIKKILEAEIAAECEVCIRRESGVDLLEYALKKDKKIFLISDMYMLKSHIMEILDKNNIKVSSNQVYVSSEVRLQKNTGNLFKHFLLNEGIKAKEGVHIGDHSKRGW